MSDKKLQKLRKLKGRKLAMYDALCKELGVITAACKLTGLSRQSHYRWLEDDDNYKGWCEQLPDMCLDFAENANYKNMREGNQQAISFFLKTKGKSRGYVEKQEVEHSGSLSNVSISIVKAEKEE